MIKKIVYELNGKEISETNYKNIEEYSVKKYNTSYKTFSTTMKYSNVLLTKQIGNGAFGKVYKVSFEKQYYALKKILMNENNQGYLDKNSELQIMKQLKSDFVVNLYDYWIKSENDFEFLYIQMELCDQTLEDIIETKNSSIPPIIDYIIRTEIFGQLLFALNYLHSMTPKVIHRDIKPSNVLIKYHNDHAQCKLCDFGLSKIYEKESGNTSNVGTTKYKAPEIFTNIYNEKVDIFSLGVLGQELFNDSFIDDSVLTKLNELKRVIENMIYSPPDKRQSASEIMDKKVELTIQINVELINLVEKVRKENIYEPIKFLNFH